MTQETRNRDIRLDDAIQAVKADEPRTTDLQMAAEDVWQRVRSEAPATDFMFEPIRGCDDVKHLLPAYLAHRLTAHQALLIEAHLRDCLSCEHQARGRAAERLVDWTIPQPVKKAAWNLRPGFGFSLAAAALVTLIAGLLINNFYFAVPAGARARIQSLDGTAYRISTAGMTRVRAGDELRQGELLRTSADAHTFVQLSDGSIVEVRDRTEFSVNARGKDTTIALDQGAVLVQAAKRKSGHLYVKTPDCRVAVTGTIFSVNSGTKGSRVAVIEGVVQVTQMGNDSVLRAGDQVTTSDNLSAVPVQQEIAWSRDHAKYVSLLAQFVALRQRLDQVPLPAPRYSSDLLDRMPTNAVLYVSIPNLGETLSQANAIFQDQLQKSAALREWWSAGNQRDHEDLNATIEKLRLTSAYLGDEVVVLGLEGAKSTEIAVIADIQRAGLADFLKSQLATSNPGHDLTVVDEAGLAGLDVEGEGIALVRDHEVIFSNSRDLLRRIDTQLNTGASGFAESDFGRQISAAYSRGAGFIVAANLHQMMRDTYLRNKSHGTQSPRQGIDFRASGLADAQYLIAEHRELNGLPENHLNLQFAGTRQGVASWLAAPAPMGSLEYVSRNAGLLLAFVAKEPEAIVDDIVRMTTKSGAQDASADLNEKLHMDLRRDVAAHIGGEAVIALDGPVLPTPSWKLVVEVHDPVQLQASLEKLMQAITEESQKNGHGGVSVQADNVSGQPFYMVRDAQSGAETAAYTYANGYMILGSSRAVVMEALRTQSSGDSLGRSANFRALLPKDENENYSAIGYQNLSPVLQPLLSQLKGDEAAAVQELAADARPTVFCAWGKDNRIEAASNSRLFGLDFLALGTLLDSGNQPAVHPVQLR